MKTKFSKLALFFILVAGFLFRFVDISNNPPALYGDELTLVYDGYSILKTGKDQTGTFLPLTFAMSEGRPPLYVYFSLPFISLFGPNELGARTLSLLSGVGIIFAMFILGKRLVSQEVGMASAFLTSILPWDLALSRGGFEAHFALLLFLIGLITFLKGKEKPWFYIFSAVMFGLTVHTYHSYKIVTPLFVSILLGYLTFQQGIKDAAKRNFIISFCAVFVLFIALWVMQIVQGSDVRYKNTNLFSNKEIGDKIIEKINYEREINYLPAPFSQLFHNKIFEYGGLLTQNYLDNFSPDFLFLSGDKNPRHNPSLMGEILFIQLLLIPIGVMALFKFNKKLLVLILGWLFIAPLPTSMVSEAHAIRSSAMIPPLIIFSAVGLINLLNLFHSRYIFRLAIFFFVFGALFQFALVAERVYFLSPVEHCQFWSCAAKQASLVAQKERFNYKYVIFSSKIDNSEHAFPVYAKIDPEQVIGQYGKFIGMDTYKFKKFDNVYIGSVMASDANRFIDSLPGSAIYIGDMSEKDYLKSYEMVNGSDKKPSLVIIKKQ